MAFNITNIEPVEFGSGDNKRKCVPSLNTEQKLRLGKAAFNTEEAEKASDKLIASCFPDDEMFVVDFLSRCPVLSKQRLQAYLIGGEEAVRALDESIINTTAETLKGKLNA